MNYANAVAIGGATIIAAAAMTITATPLDGRSMKPVIVTGEETVITRRVTYADLNLASSDGQHALHERVGLAVRDVCGEAVGKSDTWTYHYCYVGAWQDARPQIALAVERARQIALTGTSTITAAAAINFSVHN